MLTVRDLHLEIGDRALLNGVSFSLRKGQRVGLVGRNGQGKTTLLKIISGQAEYTGGEIQISKGFKMAYLPQEVVRPGKGATTIYEEAKRSFDHLLKKEQRLREITRELEGLAEDDPRQGLLLREQDALHDELLAAGFYSIKSRIESVLAGLGFRKDSLDAPVSSLSGGWIMRLELAKILLSAPDLILLDEPTNHLDLPSLAWLETFLLSQDAGCLIVSHDRTFLDNMVKEIWELEQGRLSIYKGNYSFYVKERDRRRQQQEAAWKNQQKKIEELNSFIERFRAKATKARQVQSRIKQLEKMELVEPPPVEQGYSFTLPTPKRAGKVVLEVQALTKRFGQKSLFEDLSFMLKRGSKMAVVGPNGAGKSTLLKIIAGREQQDEGQVLLGHNVKVAYFGQHQAQELKYDRSILENMRMICPGLSDTQLRTILGIFMFREDDVFKEVSVLSGGEKSRVALASIMAQGANLLLLDEPTNHLDIDAQEAVRQALASYEGSVMVVSHNRYFLDGFVDQVLELEAGNSLLFPGTVSQFLEMKKASAESEERAGSTRSEATGKAGGKGRDTAGNERSLSRKEKKRLIAELRQEKSKKLLPLKSDAERIEKEIEELEVEKEEIEGILADSSTYTDGKRAAQLNKRYSEIKTDLEELYLAWEEASQALEELKEEYDKKIMEIDRS